MRSVTTAMNSCPPSAGGRIFPVRAPFNSNQGKAAFNQRNRQTIRRGRLDHIRASL